MKKYVAVALSVVMAAALLLVGCGKESEPKTVESIVNSNDEVASTIKSGADESGVQVDVKDNTITYSYDISTVDGITDELAESEEFVKSLENSLSSQKSSFANICKTIEENAEIEGVVVTVVYKYKDKELANVSYTSADAAAEE